MKKFVSRKILPVLAAAVTIIGVAVGVGTSANAQVPASSKPQPGYWEFKTVAAGLFNDSDKYCLSQVEVERFYANPCKRNTKCVYTTKTFQPDGSIAVDGTWTDKKKRVTKVNATGFLKTNDMYLKGTARYGLPIPFSFKAHRISASCPK